MSEVASAPEVSAPVAAPAQPEVSGSQPEKKFRVKVEGNEFEVSEAQLIKDYQLARTSNDRFKRASDLQKQVAEREAKLKQDPWSVLQELGLDPDELAEQRLMRRTQWESMSDLERALVEKDYELTQIRNERDRYKTQEDEQKRSAIETQASAEIDQEIADAIKSLGISNPTPRLVARLAEELLTGYEVRKEKVQAKDALMKVKRSLHEDLKGLTSEVPFEQLIKDFLPADFVSKLREYDLKNYRQNTRAVPPVAKPSSMNQAPKQVKSKRVTIDDYFNKFD